MPMDLSALQNWRKLESNSLVVIITRFSFKKALRALIDEHFVRKTIFLDFRD